MGQKILRCSSSGAKITRKCDGFIFHSINFKFDYFSISMEKCADLIPFSRNRHMCKAAGTKAEGTFSMDFGLLNTNLGVFLGYI